MIHCNNLQKSWEFGKVENLLINKKSHEEDKGGIQARKIEEKGKEKEEKKEENKNLRASGYTNRR